jgi:hypothetical protein
MTRYLPITKEHLANAERHILEAMKTPGWEKRLQRERDECLRRVADFHNAEAPILAELHAIGIAMSTIGTSDEIGRFAPFGKEAVEIFLKWLSIPHPDVHRTLVNCLQLAKKHFDGVPVARAFDATNIATERTALAGLIEQKSPRGIDDWLRQRLVHGSDGFPKGLLICAAAKRFEFEGLREIAWNLFLELPELMTRLLARRGDERDAKFLETRGVEFSDKERKAFAKAAAKIRLRLAKPGL